MIFQTIKVTIPVMRTAHLQKGLICGSAWPQICDGERIEHSMARYNLVEDSLAKMQQLYVLRNISIQPFDEMSFRPLVSATWYLFLHFWRACFAIAHVLNLSKDTQCANSTFTVEQGKSEDNILKIQPSTIYSLHIFDLNKRIPHGAHTPCT